MTLLFGALTLAALVLRLYLKFALIDPETGFYFLEGAGPWPVMFSLLLAAAVAAAAIWVVKKRPHLPEGGFVPCRVQAGLTILSGFAAEVWAILQVLEQLSAGRDGDRMNLLALLMAVVTIGAGLYLMNLGFGDFTRRGKRQISAAGASLLILWMVGLMLSVFLSYSVVLSISDHLLTTLTLVSLVVFMVGYAKVRMEIGGDRSALQGVVGGLLAGFFSLNACLPQLAAMAAGLEEGGASQLFQLALLLALGLWGGAAALGLERKGCCSTKS